MSRVNVLCAPPNGRNPGMASVDLAFESVARDLDAEVTYWRLWDQSEWIDPPGGSRQVDPTTFIDDTSGMTYRLARHHLEEFLDAEAVVFWGDFHHMAVYLDQTADVLHRRMKGTARHEANEVAARYLLLQNQSQDVLARTITFGTTLGFNSAADYASWYGDAFNAFVGRAHGAWFRDGYSSRIAELTRAPRQDSCLGSDAAFLVDGPKQSPTADGLGVFIGRSNVTPEAVSRLGRQIAGEIGGVPRWIPWGTSPAMWPMWGRKRLRVAWPELETGTLTLSHRNRLNHLREVALGPPLASEIVPAIELLERIAECRVILTDTYHLAVNAWNIGTPAVLLYERNPSSEWNVNSGQGVGRDKRHDLYSQLDSLPLLLDIGDITSRREMPRLVRAISDIHTPVVERVESISSQARARVVTSLGALLS